MKRGKVITVLLILAVFLSLVSIAISLSVDNSDAGYKTNNNVNVPDSNSAKVGLEVIDSAETSSDNSGGVSE